MKFFSDKNLKSGAIVLGLVLGEEAIVAVKPHLAIMPDQEHTHQEPYQAPRISKPLAITMSTSADINVRSIQQWLDDAGK
jgi:hypothetical protein